MAVEDCVRDPYDSLEAQQSFIIDFVAAHQIRVVAKIPQEPVEFPQSSRSTIKPARNGVSLMLLWFEDSEPDDEKWPLGMPAVKRPVDADQEDAFQRISRPLFS